MRRVTSLSPPQSLSASPAYALDQQRHLGEIACRPRRRAGEDALPFHRREATWSLHPLPSGSLPAGWTCRSHWADAAGSAPARPSSAGSTKLLKPLSFSRRKRTHPLPPLAAPRSWVRASPVAVRPPGAVDQERRCRDGIAGKDGVCVHLHQLIGCRPHWPGTGLPWREARPVARRMLRPARSAIVEKC